MTYRIVRGGLWLLLCFSFSIQADPVRWEAHSTKIDIASEVEYRVETPETSTIESVMSLSDEQWQINQSSSISLGYGDEVYWFRVPVENISKTEVPALLEIGYAVLDYVRLHRVIDNQVVQSVNLGDKQPFYQRPIGHRNFVVPFDLPPDKTVHLYLRVDTSSSMQVPLVLWQRDAFHFAEQSRLIFEGLHFGIVLAMIFYSLFVYLAIGERSFIYYMGYITFMPLFLASLHGVSFQFLWPEATWWNDQSIVVFLNLAIACGGMFTARFLSVTSQTHPWLHRLIVVVIAGSAILASLALFLPYRYLILPTILMAFIGCSSMLVLSLARMAQKDPAARFYTVAWVFMLFGGIVLGLSKFTVLPSNFVTENATQLGLTVGVILLSIALADRMNKDKKATFEAQQRLIEEERKARLAQTKTLEVQREANAMLEDRVHERTRELKDLNQQLMQLNATDALTGLKNRRHFDSVFQSACVKAYRFGTSLSLLVIDIDHFKQFNDNHGHLVGDDCLQMVSRGIKKYVTRPQDLAARYGGEEFVILLPDTPEVGARLVAEKIRREIEQTDFQVADQILRLTISVGLTCRIPSAADETKRIFRQADEALYEAKASGRNKVVSYDYSE